MPRQGAILINCLHDFVSAEGVIPELPAPMGHGSVRVKHLLKHFQDFRFIPLAVGMQE